VLVRKPGVRRRRRAANGLLMRADRRSASVALVPPGRRRGNARRVAVMQPVALWRIEGHEGRVSCGRSVRPARSLPAAEAVAPGDLDGHYDRQHVHDARWRCRSGSATGMSRTSTTSWLRGRRDARRRRPVPGVSPTTASPATEPDREPAGGHDAGFAERRGYAQGLVSHEPLEFTWRNSEQLQRDLVEGSLQSKPTPPSAGAP
jgi:hypothetical protein